MSWFLQPLVIFPLLWLSLSTLGAFILAALIRPPAPPSDDTFSDYGDFLEALGDLTSPQSPRAEPDLLRTGARISRPSSA